jgi:hypothetical protein
MLDWSTCPAVERDPERVSRAWVFQGTPVPLAGLPAPHRVRTAHELGWGTVANGALLDQADADGFTVLVTTLPGG